ncbi:MAG: MBL fold metallo-hydrolase [Desulfobacterota bacterium]|nr:MBL fold metallo-hydrolase [Thermodesulfobacteriota bacterium]MDW8001251.1 MBL fold metallo-hydrolase [Deltaproteobacteria bacterium]
MFFEEIQKEFYRLVIPLHIDSLRSANIYVIKGKDISLIVDTGMGDEKMFLELLSSLDSIGVSLERSLVAVTHFHIDHFGFVRKMQNFGARFLLSRKDWEKAKRIRSQTLKEEVYSFLSLSGFPQDEQKISFFEDVDEIYEVEENRCVEFAFHGQRIVIGNYEFLVFFTPGHTPGHLTLFEVKTGYYLSGDHILREISPTLQARKPEDDPLKEYFKSLHSVSKLPISRVLPSHGDPFHNARERIAELFAHHRRRLAEIISLIERGTKTIYELASKMDWDSPTGDFYELPIKHKIFAMGEALAHTNYLKNKGRIKYFFHPKGTIQMSLNLEVKRRCLR